MFQLPEISMKKTAILFFLLGMIAYWFVPRDVNLIGGLPIVQYNQKFIVDQAEGGNAVCITYGWYTPSIATPKYHEEMECK